MTAIDTNPFDPLTDLRKHFIKVQGNRDYLPVSGRLVWFRSEHPDWGIVTQAIEINLAPENKMSPYAIFQATIFNADGKAMATATKMEDQRGFGDFVEKAETGSVGRALAYCGYGTQFAPELDEGERFADAPQPSNHSQQPTQRAADGSNYSNQRNSGPVQPSRNGGASSLPKCSHESCGFYLSANQAADSTEKFGRLLCVKHQREVKPVIVPVIVPDDVLLSVAAIDKDARDNSRDSGGPGGML